MPTLLPPPDFKPGELEQLGLTGTCELQICRSAGPWSLGTPERIEFSIQNAYLKGASEVNLSAESSNRVRVLQPSRCPSTLCTLRTSSSSLRTYDLFLLYVGCLIPCVYRTVVNEVKIENRIGDAIVHRIIRAHREGTPFKCCIVIPLLPGFTYPVDHSDASAVSSSIAAWQCPNLTHAWTRSVSFCSVRTVPSVEGRTRSMLDCARRGLR